jgi:hypothetical protein
MERVPLAEVVLVGADRGVPSVIDVGDAIGPQVVAPGGALHAGANVVDAEETAELTSVDIAGAVRGAADAARAWSATG